MALNRKNLMDGIYKSKLHESIYMHEQVFWLITKLVKLRMYGSVWLSDTFQNHVVTNEHKQK